MSSAFHGAAIKGYQGQMTSACHTFVSKLIESQGRVVDAVAECRLFTMDVLLRCSFSLSGSWQHDDMIKEFTENVARCIVHVSNGIYNPLFYCQKLYNYLPRGKAFRKEVADARNFAKHVIQELKKVKESNSIVSCFMDKIPIEDLIDEVTTLLFAGHDTTGHNLAFTLGLLAKHQDSFRKCKNEVDQFRGSFDDKTLESFKENFPYLDQCIKESLRLYPSVPMVGRRTDKELEIGGVHFPSQTWFCVNIYSLHRHEAFWNEPHEFKPERFNSTNIKNITPFTYIPFSCGPRNCLGANFAKATLAYSLVHVIQAFDNFEVVSFGEADLSVVLHPTTMQIKFIRDK